MYLGPKQCSSLWHHNLRPSSCSFHYHSQQTTLIAVAHSMVNLPKSDGDPGSDQDMSDTSTLPKDAVRTVVILPVLDTDEHCASMRLYHPRYVAHPPIICVCPGMVELRDSISLMFQFHLRHSPPPLGLRMSCFTPRTEPSLPTYG